MDTNCVHLVEDLFCFVMRSLCENNQARVVKAFISTSRYRGDLLNIEYAYFEQMVSRTTIN